MKISVITTVFNNKDHIEDCIKNVQSQTYPAVEHVIIDGGSTDGTLDIIARYRQRLACVKLEKDISIYDGLNKGIKIASGDAIGILHSDDLFVDKRVLEKVAAIFADNNIDAVYGNLLYVDRFDTNKIIRYWRPGSFRKNLFKKGWMIPHPTLFVKKNVYEKFGYFNTEFKISADYEIMLRFFLKNAISTYFLDEVLVKMRWGGVSNRNIVNLLKKSLEDYKICKIYGLGFSTVLLKNLSKIPQFISHN